ncbi:anillin isoform X2 [Sphaeramia orbicularis]|uniref:anillin isoform X2 n=1 Tax=Sphaeramia orbicularis TaxID=375764 RepID=UPI0011806D04|nr:anillin isoform X2 [Sphaeramia orbicularis]
MDPFTEKLLQRTRARRENLQKKIAERPNAANRQMVKRPLTDTNSVITEPVTDKVPQTSSKPSPSKRKCSEENIQPAAGEENKEPLVPRAVTPVLQDPLTDKKPPVIPASIRSTPSLEKTTTQPVVQPQLEQPKCVEPEPEKKSWTTAAEPMSSREVEMVSVSSVLQSSKEDKVQDCAPSETGMRSRLQRLANQRKCWDGPSDATPDCTPLSVLRRQADVPSAPAPSVSSGTPLGRKGRLANLAATIGSWEDDMSHANIPKENPQNKPPAASVSKFASRDVSVAASTKPADHVVVKATTSSNQSVNSPVKASQVIPPSPQKSDVPAVTPSLQTIGSPQKSSNQEQSYTSSPQKALSKPVSQSPLKNQVLSKGLGLTSSPQKPEIRAKPVVTPSSSHQEKATPGAPGVKSFLERFGERCQERTNLSSPAGGTVQAKTPTVTPSVTPNTRLVQEKLRAAQDAKTTTADLTQRQKLERESELAQIRSRFQKGNNMWKNKDSEAEAKTITDAKEPSKPINKPVENEAAPYRSYGEPTAPSMETAKTPTKCIPPGSGLVISPPASTSSPLRSQKVTEEKASDETSEKEEVKEVEMNVDQSINSAVINELFDGVLEESEDQNDEEDEDEEEDALNISSMSLLTPLAETVAAVVKSPERRMMTSTPASSFIVKNTHEKPSSYQKTNMPRTASSDSLDTLDEDHKLPYSIDAYRSTRVKETERPSVKQVIVRKEDVAHRAEEPRGSSLFSIKQKMKILTNEMNLQQTVIHQASQALNCCTDEEHGKGSQVEAEAERLLLVATERREALRAELDRLKGDPAGPSGQKKAPTAPEQMGISASRGSITLQELRLPLKADFVCSTANKPEATKHSFFIMIRAGAENTVATPLASTHRGLSGDTLTYPTRFTISDVTSDFEIDIEVYCLVQKRDICNDKKKKLNKTKAITPKRFLAITKSGQTPVVASPGGPNAVRTSNFVLVGSHKLSLSSIGKNKFQLGKIKYEGSESELLSGMFLHKVPFLCPLEGHIYLKMKCEVGSKVEERGFLTMFEDVSGFGAWHRRWCVLSGYCISYWTYPDDEKRKNPIGRLNLANCTSRKVEPANREFCARPNTFELITVRPQREDDKETLVSQCKNTMCVTKNWLSADTKDERNLWMKKLNQILMDLRMWQPDACYQPL